MATSAVSVSNAIAPVGASASSSAAAANTEDRFLKLLVAQLQNQDPLNPMDNAQVTSQMAQIQTVSGIDKLNTTVAGLNGQFAQLQVLSGVALVGRSVLIDGNRLVAENGTGQAGFELASQADRVKIEVLDGAGRVIDTAELGTLASGRHSFDWTPSAGVDPTRATHFRVAAALGATEVSATPFMRDRVEAVSVGVGGLVLELANAGPVSYATVKVFD